MSRQKISNLLESLRKCPHFYVGLFVLFVSVILALPAFTIWLGLPPEGDAVDYRVPLIKWMIRHQSYPQWPWTMVDDYPMLGELFLLATYLVHPNLMRIVPLLAYLGIAGISGAIFVKAFKARMSDSAVTLAIVAAAWVIALRPLAIQSNLLMTDNLASFFLLSSLYFVLQYRAVPAGMSLGLALATRYFAWPFSIALFLVACFHWWRKPKQAKHLFLLVFFSAIGALPFLIRNWVVNKNPIFPFAMKFFNGIENDIAYFIYGRGQDLLSFLLLPYDFLYTNSFKQAYFDYTLGKLFYLQLLATIIGLALALQKNTFRQFLADRNIASLLLFFFFYLVIWFLGSQQMRFFVPALAIANLFMLYFSYRYLPPLLFTALLFLGCFSATSIQKDSILMAIEKKQSHFLPEVEKARACFQNLPENSTVGEIERNGILGFFDFDFVYVGKHPYALPVATNFSPEYIYSKDHSPCLLRATR